MGWWKSQNGTIGDWPADIMAKALEEIEDAYLQATGRQPSQGELADLIEFCTAGCLKPECGDPKFPYSKPTRGDDDTPRAREKGYQGAMGPASIESLKASTGMVNIDPSTGDHFKVPNLNDDEDQNDDPNDIR